MQGIHESPCEIYPIHYVLDSGGGAFGILTRGLNGGGGRACTIVTEQIGDMYHYPPNETHSRGLNHSVDSCESMQPDRGALFGDQASYVLFATLYVC